MPRPAPIRVVKQRHDWDCGACCLSMLLDIPYGDVVKVVRDRYPTTHRRGLALYQMEEVAATLGRTLRRVYRAHGYLDAFPTGILGVLGGDTGQGHWVVLKGGVVIEPNHEKRGPIYELAEYLQVSKCRTATMLILEAK